MKEIKMNMEYNIILHLIKNNDYLNIVLPYIRLEYFDTAFARIIYTIIMKIRKDDMQNKIAPSDVKAKINSDFMENVLNRSKCNTENLSKNDVLNIFETIIKEDTVNILDSFIKDTEAFIKKQDLKNSMVKSINLLKKSDFIDEDPSQKIEELITNSLSIYFDKSVGLKYSDNDKDIEDRFSYYTKKQEAGFKTSLPELNELTDGGFKRKTLAFWAAQPHGGKTAMMTSCATDFIQNGYSVLYITLEMSEYEISKRIDANLFNIRMRDFKGIDKSEFIEMNKELLKSGLGTLVIKEYPTGSLTVPMINGLLKELEQKQSFVPDIIIVDYVGIMHDSAKDMYTSMKKNSEGLRGIAVQHNCFVMSAIQTNRGSIEKSTLDFSDIAESTGPAQIADFMAFIVKQGIGTGEAPDSFKSQEPFQHDLDGLDGFTKNSESTSDKIKQIQNPGYDNIVTEQLIKLQVRKNRYAGLANNDILCIQDYNYFRVYSCNF